MWSWLVDPFILSVFSWDASKPNELKKNFLWRGKLQNPPLKFRNEKFSHDLRIFKNLLIIRRRDLLLLKDKERKGSRDESFLSAKQKEGKEVSQTYLTCSLPVINKQTLRRSLRLGNAWWCKKLTFKIFFVLLLVFIFAFWEKRHKKSQLFLCCFRQRLRRRRRCKEATQEKQIELHKRCCSSRERLEHGRQEWGCQKASAGRQTHGRKLLYLIQKISYLVVT